MSGPEAGPLESSCEDGPQHKANGVMPGTPLSEKCDDSALKIDQPATGLTSVLSCRLALSNELSRSLCAFAMGVKPTGPTSTAHPPDMRLGWELLVRQKVVSLLLCFQPAVSWTLRGEIRRALTDTPVKHKSNARRARQDDIRIRSQDSLVAVSKGGEYELGEIPSTRLRRCNWGICA